MSLLLDALKKAERAKEEAQRRASGEQAAQAAASAPASPPLQLQGEEPRAGEPRQVVTRSQLPELSHGLEILSDDIRPKATAESGGAARQPTPPRDNAAASGASAQAAGARPDALAAAQRAGRKVFEAKFKESNPRLPFYITMAALGVFALGTGGYFWYQLRPPPPLINANPKPPAGERAVAAAPVPSSGAPAAGATGSGSGPTAGIAGLPQAAAPAAPVAPVATAPAAPKAPAPSPATSIPPSQEAAKRIAIASTPGPTPPAAAAPRRAAREAPRESVTSTRPAAQVHPQVESGYAAYLAGDVARARTQYEEALRGDPTNRDALLGLAAVAVRGGRFETAEATYRRVLQIDPRDPHAQAGLIALRSGRIDPVAAESRVKSLLATDPGAHVLHFTLGNQLAQQGRWAEAQQQYFKAFAAEPDNADFAYNLAVSLDQLRQPKLALEYYQRAVALAGQRGSSFDAGAARQRIAQLGR
jgi:tetratricopeptide (TPR) repeat protein